MGLKAEQQIKEKTSELEGGIALNSQENTEKNKGANSLIHTIGFALEEERNSRADNNRKYWL